MLLGNSSPSTVTIISTESVFVIVFGSGAVNVAVLQFFSLQQHFSTFVLFRDAIVLFRDAIVVLGLWIVRWVIFTFVCNSFAVCILELSELPLVDVVEEGAIERPNMNWKWSPIFTSTSRHVVWLYRFPPVSAPFASSGSALLTRTATNSSTSDIFILPVLRSSSVSRPPAVREQWNNGTNKSMWRLTYSCIVWVS